MAADLSQGRHYKVNALERAVDVLETFTPEKPELRLVDVAAASGLHKVTALRLLATLTRRGLIVRHAKSGRYRLGQGLVHMAEIAKVQPPGE